MQDARNSSPYFHFCVPSSVFHPSNLMTLFKYASDYLSLPNPLMASHHTLNKIQDHYHVCKLYLVYPWPSVLSSFHFLLYPLHFRHPGLPDTLTCQMCFCPRAFALVVLPTWKDLSSETCLVFLYLYIAQRLANIWLHTPTHSVQERKPPWIFPGIGEGHSRLRKLSILGSIIRAKRRIMWYKTPT